MKRLKPKSLLYLSVVLLVAFTASGFDAGLPPACPDIPMSSGPAAIDAKSDSGDLTVVSLNMARETDAARVLRDIRNSPFSKSADVWLFQEAVRREQPAADIVPAVAEALGLHYVAAGADVLDEGVTSGLAILSRDPIEDPELIRLPRYDLRFRTRCRVALAANVMRATGPIRIFNVHLDTRITEQQRMGQIEPILQQAMSSKTPVLVGGDFNSANIRWVGNVFPIPYGQTHAQALRSLFTSGGFESPLDGSGGTFHLLWIPLRLDWIFHKGFRTVSAGVQDMPFSDHEAVWVSVQ